MELRLLAIADVYLFFRTTDHRIHSQALRGAGVHHPIPLLPPSIIAANNKQLRSLDVSALHMLKAELLKINQIKSKTTCDW